MCGLVLQVAPTVDDRDGRGSPEPEQHGVPSREPSRTSSPTSFGARGGAGGSTSTSPAGHNLWHVYLKERMPELRKQLDNANEAMKQAAEEWHAQGGIVGARSRDSSPVAAGAAKKRNVQ